MKAKKKDPKKRNSLPQEASAAVAGGRGGALSPEVATFRGDQVKLLAKSGWNCCSSIREGLKKVNRPVPRLPILKLPLHRSSGLELTKRLALCVIISKTHDPLIRLRLVSFWYLIRTSLILAPRLTQPFVAIRLS